MRVAWEQTRSPEQNQAAMEYRATWGTGTGNGASRASQDCPHGEEVADGSGREVAVGSGSWADKQVVTGPGPPYTTSSGPSGPSGPSGSLSPVESQWTLPDMSGDLGTQLVIQREVDSTDNIISAISRGLDNRTLTNLDPVGPLTLTGATIAGRRHGNNKRRHAARRQRRSQRHDKDCLGKLDDESSD